MSADVAFPVQTDAPLVLADLSYIDNPSKDRWLFAGPYRIPFVLTLTPGPAGSPAEARLTAPTIRLENWTGAANIGFVCASESIRCDMPPAFDYPEQPEERAYAIVNHMAYQLRIEAVRTVRGALSDLTGLLQALANLTGRKFIVTCATDKDGGVQISSSKSDLIENVALLITLYFLPYGTAPAQIHRANIAKRDLIQLPQIFPERDRSAHQNLDDTAKLQAFLEGNMNELGLTPKTLKNRMQAIGI